MAVERLEHEWIDQFPEFEKNFRWFLRNRSSIAESCVSEHQSDAGPVHLLSLVNKEQLEKILSRVWDPMEFLSPYGLRSLSKHHAEQPYRFGNDTVGYEAAESQTHLKGGNSNWRGPIWFPTTFLMIESLRKLSKVLEDDLVISSNETSESMTLDSMAGSLANRMIGMFTRDESGRRPIYGDNDTMQHDPHWRDVLLFHEYFNAETGEGLGACHQTGWTGLVASLIDEWRR